MKLLCCLLAIFSLVVDAIGADAESLPKRFGKVIELSGKAVVIASDGTERQIRIGDELPAGTVIKTEKTGTVDLFFRRIGTIVHLETNTVVSLDKLEVEMKEGKMVKKTELSLKEGKFIACIRVLIPESKVIVRPAKVTFHVPGTGMGRFQFSADGSAIVGRKSKLSLVADSAGGPVSVAPGFLFDEKSTNVVQPNPAFFDEFSKAMDKLQNTASDLTPPPAPEDLPAK